MKRKFNNIFFLATILISLFIGPSVTTLAVNLPAKAPVGYDKPGQYPAGKIQNISYYSKETKSNRTMVVYTPPGYSKNKKYPVIYAIHGINSKPSTIFDYWCVAAGTLADNLIGQGKIEPVIIVAMDNNNVNSHNELFNNVMPYAESHYPIIKDADHRGIYGYSMGGGVTFAEGMGNLDTFHHVCPSSATPFNHPSDKVMFNEQAKKKLKTLVLSCGTIDWCGFYNANKASHDYCESIGLKNYWLSVPGGDHNGKDVWRPAMWYFLQLAFPTNRDSVPDVDTKPETKPVITQGETAKLADGWYKIKNVNAGKYLQVEGNKAKAATNVELSTGVKDLGQKWYLKNLSNGYVTLTSALGEFMLDVSMNENKDGSNMQIYNGYSGESQQFMLKKSNTKGAYVIATKSSKLTKVLDGYKNGKEDRTNVCQWTYSGRKNQQWIFEATDLQVEEKPETKPGQSTPSVNGLKLEYTINSWESAYQVNFKISNNSALDVNSWTVKIKKSDINIHTSWNITVKEVGDYYVITPVEWNKNIAKGGSIEFGIQGTGTIGKKINYILQ